MKIADLKALEFELFIHEIEPDASIAGKRILIINDFIVEALIKFSINKVYMGTG